MLPLGACRTVLPFGSVTVKGFPLASNPRSLFINILNCSFCCNANFIFSSAKLVASSICSGVALNFSAFCIAEFSAALLLSNLV